MAAAAVKENTFDAKAALWGKPEHRACVVEIYEDQYSSSSWSMVKQNPVFSLATSF